MSVLGVQAGGGGGGGGGVSHMKGAGMRVVSLRGVNFEFWSHFSYSEQNTSIFSHEVFVRVACKEI